MEENIKPAFKPFVKENITVAKTAEIENSKSKIENDIAETSVNPKLTEIENSKSKIENDIAENLEYIKQGEEKLNSEYIDKRSITIELVNNYSLYRKINSKVLPKRRDFIGGSIKASMMLSSNHEECAAYFPNILGISSNHPEFVTRIKQYLNNISVPVTELGKKLDTTFIYNQKRDYYSILNKEEEIERKYQEADKSSIKKLREAIAIKIEAINVLESTKYRYGRPYNITDYILYRHCLLYSDVAKDMSLCNVDQRIRFYFKDENKEAQIKKKLQIENNLAKRNYVQLLNDANLFNSVYILYLVNDNKSLDNINKDRLDKEIDLDKFSIEEPIKFNKLVNDKHIKLKAFIETLILKGELIRSAHSQNISTPDGDFIGANMNEAISYFINPKNEDIKRAFEAKLNYI